MLHANRPRGSLAWSGGWVGAQALGMTLLDADDLVRLTVRRFDSSTFVDLAKADAVAVNDPRFYLYLNEEFGFIRRGSDSPYLALDTYLSKGAYVFDAWPDEPMPTTPYRGRSRVIVAGRSPARPEPEQWLNDECTLQNVCVSIPDAQYEEVIRNPRCGVRRAHPNLAAPLEARNL